MKECAIKKYAITAISRDVTVRGEVKTVHRIIALKILLLKRGTDVRYSQRRYV